MSRRENISFVLKRNGAQHSLGTCRAILTPNHKVSGQRNQPGIHMDRGRIMRDERRIMCGCAE